jgi:tripartite-type tricarboxylate transporter receptor subunit TctC
LRDRRAGVQSAHRGRASEVIASTPEEMTAHLKKEIAKWRVVFKEQGIKAD